MDTQSSAVLTLSDLRLIRRFYAALRLLISLNRRMTTTQAMTFLHVAFEEGLSVATLAERCGVRPHTISKHLRDLGPTNRRGEPSLGLITAVRKAHHDRRQYFVILTPRGTALARKMYAIMRHGFVPSDPPSTTES
jgi:DNA-binding MarR family transcriptional regulator